MPRTASAGSVPTFLMCPPRFFDVQYVINPWMQGNLHASSPERAAAQWQALHAAIAVHAHVQILEPEPGLPDMVFTANAGLVHAGVALLSRFRCEERAPEETHFARWFQDAGLTVQTVQEDTPFEGEGDALFTPDRTRLWAGYGWRSAQAAMPCLQQLWPQIEVTPLRLIDPRFYHLDTCFCPLANGDLLYYPPALDTTSLARIEAYYPPEHRIAVTEEDAIRFACNAVSIGSALVVNEISAELRGELETRGFIVHPLPLGEFLKAGGAAKCLCLRVA